VFQSGRAVVKGGAVARTSFITGVLGPGPVHDQPNRAHSPKPDHGYPLRGKRATGAFPVDLAFTFARPSRKRSLLRAAGRPAAATRRGYEIGSSQ
jgi:hypothetical protein